MTPGLMTLLIVTLLVSAATMHYHTPMLDMIRVEFGASAQEVGWIPTAVVAGYVFGLPVNITFMGTAWSEPTLIRLAYAFEGARGPRQAPRFLPSL